MRTYRRALHEISPGHPLALHPVLADATSQAGRAQGHYFHQDLWAARKLIDTRPSGHVDVGSRIDGFVAHLLAAGLTVTVVDLRPLIAPVEGLRFVRDDAMSMRSFDDGSIASLSCLHALEHFGLGRYGDPIDPLGWERACDAFSRILLEGGRLLVSVPVGRERTEFNAHRVFAPHRLVQAMPALSLRDFAAVDDEGRLRQGCDPEEFAGASFALGMYEFEKSTLRATTE